MRTPILALVLALTLAGCGARPQSERSAAHGPELANGDVAKVGSQFISTAQVDALLGETAVSFRALDRPFPKVGTPYYLDLRDQAVGYLVKKSARAQDADRLGAQVDPAELRRELERIDQRAFATRLADQR